MRIIVDTNILIPLEDHDCFNERLAELSRLVAGKHELLYHPGSCDDINQDKNQRRREMMRQRLLKYNALEHPPELSESDEEKLFGRPKKRNDRVDNLILYALQRNCVHWLITEDKGLHKKARHIKEGERVFRVDEAIASLRAREADDSRLHPHLQDLPCHALDLKNPFFDSLREGYDGFDQWFREKCCQPGRKAWVSREKDVIHFICIYKEEQNETVTSEGLQLSGWALKLCTFKVQTQGYKLGELLLKQAFTYAIDNGFKYVYATVQPDKHPVLEELLIDFGFQPKGVDPTGRDQVYVKYFSCPLPATKDSNLEYAIKYYPSFRLRAADNTAYLVPIVPRYHRMLFPEKQRQGDLLVNISNSAGNSIKQAYLCNASSRSIAPGDVLFFYRTEDEMAITTYGVVDRFLIETDADQIYKWVAKRTVYSHDEIADMAGGQVKVILFRTVGHLNNPITYKQLNSLGIVKGPIQSITSLAHGKAKTIIREACINDCLVSD